MGQTKYSRPDELGIAFNPRCCSKKTSFSEAAARKAAARLKDSPIVASVQRVPAFSGPARSWFVRLWNWQTRRAANVDYEEDFDAGIAHVGPVDPRRPRSPRHTNLWRDC